MSIAEYASSLGAWKTFFVVASWLSVGGIIAWRKKTWQGLEGSEEVALCIMIAILWPLVIFSCAVTKYWPTPETIVKKEKRNEKK